MDTLPGTAAKPTAAGTQLLVDLRPTSGGHGVRGIGRYVRGLASLIPALPEELFARIWALDGSATVAFGQRAIEAGDGRLRGLLPRWATGAAAIRRAVGAIAADVVHATDPQRPWTSGGVRTLTTVYDLIPLREADVLGSWRADYRLLYGRYLRQVKSAARVIAISRSTAIDVHERLGVPLERIDVVYPVVAAPPSPAWRPTDPETFLVVGAVDPHKQPDLAVRALALHRARHGDGCLRFIGPIDSTAAARIRGLAAELGVVGHVFVDGFATDEVLEDAYQSATAVISASRIEGFGLPAVEAVLRGTPVIAVDTPAARETLEGAAAIVPGVVEAVAAAMGAPQAPGSEAIRRLRDRVAAPSVSGSLEAAYRAVLD